MSPRDRIRAALSGERTDRPPVALWRHWPEDDQVPSRQAAREVEHCLRLGLDILKVTPSASYLAEAWGAETRYSGDALGVREYLRRPIGSLGDWGRLAPASVEGSPSLADAVETVRLVRTSLPDRIPVLPTIFSPLSVARYLAGEQTLMRHLADDPDAVVTALRPITETLSELISAYYDAGADGIYLSLFPASESLVSESQYRDWILPFDQETMSAAPADTIRIAHFHLPRPLLGIAPELSVDAVSWEHGYGPTLDEGHAITGKAVIGGVDQFRQLLQGTPDDVRAAVRDARRRCGRHLILATSCSYSPDTSSQNLRALLDEAKRASASPDQAG